MGRFRWGTYEPKAWVGIEMVTDPLTGNTDGSISADIADDENGLTRTGVRGPTNSTTGVGKIFGVGLIGKAHDWFEPTITINRGPTASQAPILRRVTLRALPTPKIVEQFDVPIIMSATVLSQTGEGQEFPYDTGAEYDYLVRIVQDATVVTFQLGSESHLVTIREVGWQNVYGMTPDRLSLEGIIMATLVTTEA